MNRSDLRFTALALAALFLIAPMADAGPRHEHHDRHWEALGTLSVSDARDHDVLAVTHARGTFRSLKLEVLDRAVQFRSMKIHFGNGDTQDVELRHVIEPGGESRVIDVEGAGDRVIRSIEFTYDAQALGGKKARVRVFGKN